jgi:MFS family permease
LIAARALQGIGGGALWPTSFAIAYRAFLRHEWGRATALIGVPVLLAPVLGPVVGGYLTTAFSWRAIFAINLPLGVAAFILAAVILRGRVEDEPAGEEPASPAHAFDVLGFVLSAAACLVSGRAGLAACLQRHAMVLGLNDGFSLTLVVCSLLVVLACFVGHDPSLQALKAVAATPTEVLAVDRAAFCDVVAQSAKTAQDLQQTMGERLAVLQ